MTPPVPWGPDDRAEAIARWRSGSAPHDRGVADLVVVHRLDDGAHTLAWAGDRLVGWEEGGSDRADLVVTRAAAVDAADLAGDGDPTAIALATTIDVGPHRGVDLLLTDGAVPKEVDGWTIETATTCRLDLADAPFGPVSVLLRWRDAALHLGWGERRPADVEIELPYADALAWMWGDLVLGHLLARGLRAEAADLFRLSEVEGLVSCPATVARREADVATAVRHARARRGPAADELAAAVRGWGTMER